MDIEDRAKACRELYALLIGKKYSRVIFWRFPVTAFPFSISIDFAQKFYPI